MKKEIMINPAEILIAEIEELPIAIRNILKRNLHLTTLEEVLNTDYEVLRNARRMGEHYLEILLNYIHSLGYVVNGEEQALDAILKVKREQGTLLENVVTDSKLCIWLYKNNIYTIEELVAYGSKVYQLEGCGIKRQHMINEILGSMGIEIEKKKLVQVSAPLELVVKEYETGNQLIRDRLTRKRQLLEEYQRLMVEREELLQEEAKLDQLIAEKQNELEVVPNGKTLSITPIG